MADKLPDVPGGPHLRTVAMPRDTNAGGGSVAKIAVGRAWPRSGTDQAATWNSSATKAAWARMSRPPMPRTCPFLTSAIAS